MTAHQTKKPDMEAPVAFRDRFDLPLTERDLGELRFYRPELERDARAADRSARLGAAEGTSHLTALLPGPAPIVAASDDVRAVPGLIAPYVEAQVTLLGTDGFGRSSNRATLRDFFEVDRRHIALAAVAATVRAGHAPQETHDRALAGLSIDRVSAAPWTL